MEETLILVSAGEPPGVMMRDLISWARMAELELDALLFVSRFCFLLGGGGMLKIFLVLSRGLR